MNGVWNALSAQCFAVSLTVSTKVLFLSRILSVMLIREFFMLFLTLVTSCMLLGKRFSKRAWPIYPLLSYNSPFIFFRNGPCFNCFRSSIFPGVSIKFRILLLSLIIRCNLSPKNHPMELLPYLTIPLIYCGSVYFGRDRHARLWSQ